VRRVIWSKKADADFDEAYFHATALGHEHAARLLDLLDVAQSMLARHPLAGVTISRRGYRKWLLRPLPYGLLYEVRADAVLIVRLIHLRSDWQASA
jgi:toxin ParE1/3/4